jgi:hypothetical protein
MAPVLASLVNLASHKMAMTALSATPRNPSPRPAPFVLTGVSTAERHALPVHLRAKLVQGPPRMIASFVQLVDIR